MEYLSRSEIDYHIEDCNLSEIFNYNERAVLDALRDLYARSPSLCRCRICVEDTYALALNSLPARYVQETRVGQYERSATYIPEHAVHAKVEEAAAKVGDNPNH